jgi:hypothetical protein
MCVLPQALFPDNSYRHDSGGDPEVIPKLTYEQFQVRQRRRCAAASKQPSAALHSSSGDIIVQQQQLL